MKVYLGADHRGFKLKEELKTWLTEEGFGVEDLGAFEYDPNDDYPVFAERVARRVAEGFKTDPINVRGIVFCGSGVGVDIVVNKFKQIRSGLAINSEQIRSARFDDDINILAIPADYIKIDEAKKIVKIFLETPFSQEEKKKRRLSEIRQIENEK